VATAVDSVAARQQAPLARSSPLDLWHLLSLDAPTVAALWSWFFARAMSIDLPWHAPLILAIGTWLVYVTDRILDGVSPRAEAALQPRHLFHARHRKPFFAAAIALSAVLVWLIAARMSAGARHEDTVLFLIAAVYLVLVHVPRKRTAAWMPKELAVAIVFAAATAVPAWSRLASGRTILLPAVVFFSALCWLNCVAIDRWEGRRSAGAQRIAPVESHLTTRWIADRLQGSALSLTGAATAIVAVAFYMGSATTAPIYLAVLLAALSFALLDKYSARFSTMGLRIVADLLLLTPVLFLPLTGR
jgi:hypothetical protein